MSRPNRYTKRKNTPALNRRRAVEYRHRRYNPTSIILSNDNEVTSINDTLVLENNIFENPSFNDSFVNEPVKESVIEEVKKEDIKVKEVIKEKPLTRKERNNAYLDSLINEPKANIFKMLLFPGKAVKDVASVEGITLNAISIFVINMCKWIAFGAVFASIIGKYINIFPFSTTRLNFSSMAKISIFIALMAIICEYLSFLLISMYCGLQKDNVKMHKLADISARGSVLPTALYIISILLIYFKNTTIGAIFAIATMLIALVLKVYGFTENIKISVTKQLPIYFLCIILSLLAFIKVIPFFAEDLISILKNIMNL